MEEDLENFEEFLELALGWFIVGATALGFGLLDCLAFFFDDFG